MPCVIVKLEPYALGDVTIDQVIDVIMDQTAATERPVIKREKDAEGKLHKAMLCFGKDTISKPDLKLARDICMGRADIVFGVQFPLDFQDDMEALTAGDPIANDKLLGNPSSSEIPFVRVSPDNAGAAYRVSADGEGTVGSGKALKMIDQDLATDTTFHRMVTSFTLNANDVDSITNFTAWKMDFDFKRPLTWAVPADQPDNRAKYTLTINSFSFKNNTIKISASSNNSVVKLQYTDSLNVVKIINTPVLWDEGYMHVSLRMRSDGEWILNLNNGEFIHTEDLGVAAPAGSIATLVTIDDLYNASRTVEQEPVYIDNLVYSIDEGELV